MAIFNHNPVMVEEVLTGLQPRPGGRYLDGTIGGGGHAAAILAMSTPTGWLYGCDRDGAAIEAAQQRLAPYAGRFELRQTTFAQVAGWIAGRSCDGAVLDLGVSSAQLDQPDRGFSFAQDGPLDMRMDQGQGMTAAQILAEASEGELSQWFWELGGEEESRRLARRIVEARQTIRLESTRQLADLVANSKRRKGGRVHPATKVFQALRIVVNNELASLPGGLEAVWSRIKLTGRLAVITFHSGEDRIVKDFSRSHARDYLVPGEVDIPELRQPRPPDLKLLARKAIQPSATEIASNPRARSAQLRVMERIYDP